MKSFLDSKYNQNRTARFRPAILTVLAVCAFSASFGQTGGALETLQIRPNFYMIAGAGGNIGVQVGSDGVVLVDAGRADMADQVVAAVKKITDKPIRYIINTGADADHVGGNAKVAKAGKTFFNVSGPRSEMALAMTNGGAAAILASDAVLSRMSATVGQGTAFPSAGWPTEAFFQSRKAIYLNHEGLKKDREGQSRTAYSLRHTYICLRLMEGADIYQIAKNCRTSVEMIEKYYASHLKNSLDASAINIRKKKAKKSEQPAEEEG